MAHPRRAPVTSSAQTRAIHALRRTLGMTETDYRGLLKARFRVVSSSDLNEAQAGALIEELKGGAPRVSGRSPAKTASGKYAPVLQALWISGYQLGVVHSRDDAAMLAFVERQTGLPHTRFLNDPADAARAIEGLKAWLAREAEIIWPNQRDADDEGRDLAWLRAREVTRALSLRLQTAGGFKPFLKDGSVWPEDICAYGYRRGLPGGFHHYAIEDWRHLTAWLGARLRATLAKQKEGQQ